MARKVTTKVDRRLTVASVDPLIGPDPRGVASSVRNAFVPGACVLGLSRPTVRELVEVMGLFVVLGATGQIGSMVVGELAHRGHEVRGVGRDLRKLNDLNEMAETFQADMLDPDSLEEAFAGGDAAFLLTPEDPRCEHCLEKVRAMVTNCREALVRSGVTRVIGLSSMGAQNGAGRGNLEASHVLELALSELDIEVTLVRPAYYYSNWLGYIGAVTEHGVLPTFFPVDLSVPMVAPPDVAAFLAEAMAGRAPRQGVIEIMGPRDLSSRDIARTFGEVLGREVVPQQVPPEEWEGALAQAGFSTEAARNLALMTKAVIDGETGIETDDPIRLPTELRAYLESSIESGRAEEEGT